MKKERKKSQPIVYFSSIKDEANTQLPAAAVASTNISSLGQQRLIIEEEEDKSSHWDLATSTQCHFPVPASDSGKPLPKGKAQPVVPRSSTCCWLSHTAREAWCGWDHWVVPSTVHTLPRAIPNHNKQVPRTKLCQCRFQFS